MGGLRRPDKASAASFKSHSKKRKHQTSSKQPTKPERNEKRKLSAAKNHEGKSATSGNDSKVTEALPLEPFRFFLDEFQTANDVQISSLELEAMKDTCMLGPPQSSVQDDEALEKHVKQAFASSWKDVLCKGKLLEGKVEPGSPAVLLISTSALRSIEILKGLRSLTRECHAVKLFSKHMKIEEQMKMIEISSIRGKGNGELDSLHVALLKNRVNIASGTPSRIKKLIDIEALGLSRLAVIVLDIHPDVKGYSLLSLPQVRDEFWDLYKSYFHRKVVEGEIRICLFGPLQQSRNRRKKEITMTK